MVMNSQNGFKNGFTNLLPPVQISKLKVNTWISFQRTIVINQSMFLTSGKVLSQNYDQKTLSTFFIRLFVGRRANERAKEASGSFINKQLRFSNWKEEKGICFLSEALPLPCWRRRSRRDSHHVRKEGDGKTNSKGEREGGDQEREWVSVGVCGWERENVRGSENLWEKESVYHGLA